MGMIKAALHDEVYRICSLLKLEGDGDVNGEWNEELNKALWVVATATLKQKWERGSRERVNEVRRP